MRGDSRFRNSGVTMTLLVTAMCLVTVNTKLTLAADPIVGQATVIDGDTIEIRGQRIRLSGMDAFEARQSCQGADGEDYRCGRDAAFALDEFIGRQNVTCEPNGKSWNRITAVCWAGDVDLGGWMVSEGHAVDDDRYQPSYWWAELLAWWEDSGAWVGSFERPRVWRGR